MLMVGDLIQVMPFNNVEVNGHGQSGACKHVITDFFNQIFKGCPGFASCEHRLSYYLRSIK